MNEANVKSLARRLMVKHGFADWTFKLDNASRRLGLCDHKSKTISVSPRHVQQDTDENIRDTILHEIAHALSSDDVVHGKEWKTIASRIGATPKRCGDSVIEPHWEATCPKCGRSFRQYRYEELRCGNHSSHVLMQWRNIETGETWSERRKPKYKYIFVCSGCNQRLHLLSSDPIRFNFKCPCKHKRKEWLRTRLTYEEWFELVQLHFNSP